MMITGRHNTQREVGSNLPMRKIGYTYHILQGISINIGKNSWQNLNYTGSKYQIDYLVKWVRVVHTDYFLTRGKTKNSSRNYFRPYYRNLYIE